MSNTIMIRIDLIDGKSIIKTYPRISEAAKHYQNLKISFSLGHYCDITDCDVITPNGARTMIRSNECIGVAGSHVSSIRLIGRTE